MSSISDLAQAIAQNEGYGANPSNRPTRLNNPGDLTGTGYAGQIGTDPQGFAIFASPAAGYSALNSYLTSHVGAIASGSATGPYSSLTPQSSLQDFLNIYAGNPDSGYVNGVAAGAGVAPSTPLGQLAALFGLGRGQSNPLVAGAAPGPAGDIPTLSVDGILAGLSAAPAASAPAWLPFALAGAAGLVVYALVS